MQEDHEVASRRLLRRRHDRVLGGVAGGLADSFGLDPLTFRLAFMILALFGGAGLLLYALGWLFIPERGAEEAVAATLTRDVGVRKLAALALIGIALLLLSGPVWMPLTGSGLLDPTLGWAFVLIVLGFRLLRGGPAAPEHPDDDGRAQDRPPARASESTNPAVADDVERARWWPPVPGSAPAVRRPRRRSPLGWLAVAVALLVVGVGALLDRSSVVTVDAGTMLALPLVVLGAGLIVGAFWGRGRWLIAIGALLLPVAVAANLVDFPAGGQVGGHYLSPQSESDLSDRYDLLAGSLTLDMRNFDFDPGRPVRVPLQAAIADMTIAVPWGVAVDLRGHVEAGMVSFFGEQHDGVDMRFDESVGRPGLERRLLVDVDAQYGWVELYRSGVVKDLRARPNRSAGGSVKQQGEGETKKATAPRNRGPGTTGAEREEGR
jgi:phage shock protein PspC (stress-responsive transcriptional regulator)